MDVDAHAVHQAMAKVLAISGLADDITRQRIDILRDRMAADLVNGWSEIKPRMFDFDGKTFRKPGGIAPQMVWDKKTNQMVLQLYIGANPALPVPLRPVSEFHDSPWASG